jgi:N-acetylglucosaminyl-diphospho-decaprenol L-rhamnosyltransferase
MWSRVYFEKKYSSKFLINVKYTFLLFPQFLKIIFYSLLLNKKEVINKTMRLSGTFNSLIGRSSWFRPKLIHINK